ncbi:hypothetical protein RZN22_07455 [Bacillaceae bacterium S4-13-58]
MGKCSIDHSMEDTRKKLDEQRPFLPQNLAMQLSNFLEQDLAQGILNEVFHLLKKYDLASEEEREDRNKKLETIVSQ